MTAVVGPAAAQPHLEVAPTAPGAPITVVLAHQSGRAAVGIEHGLARHGLSVLGVADRSAEAVALVQRHRPSVCVLDDVLAGSETAIEEIRAIVPPVRIAVLSDSLADADVLRAVRAGADGYLLKSTAPDRMTAAIRALVRGETSLPRAFTSRLVAEVRRPPPRRIWRRFAAAIRYPVLLLRHYRRRRRMRMSRAAALRSARRRMQRYGYSR